MSASPSDLGGYSEVTFRVAGDSVWSRMKFEAGPHRVQRVPVTESQGRVHTSSATVAVLPEADEVEVRIDPGDLNIDVFRSSGPGGQSVNTTDSAVRITHLPTGLVVSMQDEKSQIQNRAKAMSVLRARLLELERQRRSDDAAGQKKAQIGGGGRSEKIRTYNFKENRVTDHRIGLTLYHLDRVLAGELDEVSDALITDDRARRLTEVTGAAVVSPAPDGTSPGGSCSPRPRPGSLPPTFAPHRPTPVGSSPTAWTWRRRGSRARSTSSRPSAASPASTRWCDAAPRASRCSTCWAHGGSGRST